MDGQRSWSDRDSWFGKMFQELLAPTEEKTSKPSLQRSQESSKQKLPMFLYLTKENGANPDASWVTEMTDSLFPSLGDYTMRSFGEQPSTLMDECGIEEHRNGVSVSHLSQILEEDVLPKYYLSARACQGILNRADKRGKPLPEILREALEEQIHDKEELHTEN